jgi:hypothetical protein
MTFRTLIPEFAGLLDERIPLGGVISEEDLRFTFLYALTKFGECKHWEISSEVPLPSNKGRRLDALVSGSKGHRLAVEFKYHREKLSTLPKPKLAGGIFSDLFRLGVAHANMRCECYFIYLTDSTMYRYLLTQNSQCSDIFALPERSRLTLGFESLIGKSPTFLSALNGFMNPIQVEVLLKAKLDNELWLSVFSVEHVPDNIYNWD